MFPTRPLLTKLVVSVVLCAKLCVSQSCLADHRLFSERPLFTERPLLSKIEWGSWLAWGSYWNSHGLTTETGNAPLGFNNIAGPSIQQAWLHAGHEAETGRG